MNTFSLVEQHVDLVQHDVDVNPEFTNSPKQKCSYTLIPVVETKRINTKNMERILRILSYQTMFKDKKFHHTLQIFDIQSKESSQKYNSFKINFWIFIRIRNFVPEIIKE